MQNVSPDVSGRHFEEALPVNSFTSGRTLHARLERRHGSCSSFDSERRDSVQEELNTGKMYQLSVEVSSLGLRTREGVRDTSGELEGDDHDVLETERSSKDGHHTEGGSSTDDDSTTEEPDGDINKHVATS